MKTCKKCKKTKTETKFRKRRSECRMCEADYARSVSVYRNVIIKKNYYKYPMKALHRMARDRAVRKGLDFTIDEAYLIKIFNEQNKTCALSNISFCLREPENDKDKDFRPSLDRIDSSFGYVKGNCRIILWGLNRAIGQNGLDTYLLIAETVISQN